jgi:hypothetical protein
MLCEIILTQCDDRALHALAANGTNSADRWICQNVSLSSTVITFKKASYFEELLDTSDLHFSDNDCYVRVVSMSIGGPYSRIIIPYGMLTNSLIKEQERPTLLMQTLSLT